MDLRLFVAVVKRYKMLVGIGLILAVVLAGYTYKTGTKPVYEAQSELLISQSNDPYGRAGQNSTPDTGYLSQLSGIYAALANGDSIAAVVRRDSGVVGTIQAAELIDANTGDYQPLFTITSSASTPTGAVKLATTATRVLQSYVAQQQSAAYVTPTERVVLQIVKDGTQPLEAGGGKITVPMLLFVGILGAVLTLAFTLENLNPKSAVALRGNDGTGDRGYGGQRPAEVFASAPPGLVNLHHGNRYGNGASTPHGAGQHGASGDASGRPVLTRLLRNRGGETPAGSGESSGGSDGPTATERRDSSRLIG
jgi:capsular polysaccharide biosynthesis protein